jgi:hypothetical protein
MQLVSTSKISVAELGQEKDDLASCVAAWADTVKVFNAQAWAGQTQICHTEVWADAVEVSNAEVWAGAVEVSNTEVWAGMVKVFNTQVWAGQTQIYRPEVWADGNSESVADKEVIETPAFHTEVCVTGDRTDIDQSGTGSNASQLRI